MLPPYPPLPKPFFLGGGKWERFNDHKEKEKVPPEFAGEYHSATANSEGGKMQKGRKDLRVSD